MATLILQNRLLPPDLGGTRVVYAWDAEAPEAFCEAEDQAFTDDAHRVIVAGTDHCALHGLRPDPCPTSYRVPPQCPHARIDPQADPSRPRCATCGAVGTDESARYLRSVDRLRDGWEPYAETEEP